MPNPTIKTQGSKQLKIQLLDALQAVGGKNKIISTIKQDMQNGDNSSFWNLVKTCSSFVPKDVNVNSDTGLMSINLMIPTPSNEVLPSHVTVSNVDCTVDAEPEALEDAKASPIQGSSSKEKEGSCK